jgi:hypothetical protein
MSKHLVLSDTARNVLANASIIGTDRLVLPPGQLDRGTYQEIDKVLKAFGGKWNRSARAHIFATDPRAKVQALVDGEKVVDQRKANGYFPTPEPVADQLVALADLEPGMSVLEPSAGQGALLLAAFRRVG